MSFSRPFAEAQAIIQDREESVNIGVMRGAATSQILRGQETPGGAANMAKPSNETQIVGRLRAGINKPRTRTDKLTRKYGASGS